MPAGKVEVFWAHVQNTWKKKKKKEKKIKKDKSFSINLIKNLS